MACFIYKLYKEKEQVNIKANELDTRVETLENTIDNIKTKTENENITELFIENIFTNQKITDKKLTVFAVITVVTCISFYLAKNVKKYNKERYILHYINANCRYNIFGAITVDI